MRHRNFHHQPENQTIEKNKKCDHCDRNFESEELRSKHMETEHKACVKCNRKFKNITAMNNHVARFHTEAFTCKECDRSFKIKAALEVHILKTHGNATVIFENGEFDCCRKINEKYNNAPSN